MAEKSIIIIGAGIAGLSAGCYGQMNGYKTRIFEMHTIPGGLCTSWKRRGYTFDGCLHWLMGSRSGVFHRFYEELGAVQGRRMFDPKEFVRIEGDEGKTLILHADIDQLEQHLKELSPDDAEIIEDFCKTARIFSRLELPMEKPGELMGLFDKLKLLTSLPKFKAVGKYGEISLEDFAASFSDPFLRKAFESMSRLVWETESSASVLINALGSYHIGNGGLPMGGSLEFAKAIEKRYLGLGGEVQYRARVEKILVEDDRAVGVRLVDGTECRADMVISAADGHATIFDMLEGKYVNDTIRSYYEEWPIYGPAVYISLGVARDLSNEPHSIIFSFKEPLTVADEGYKELPVKHFSYDPSFAPIGKSVINVFFPKTSYKYWSELHTDLERYRAEKQRLADAVIARLEERFAGITAQVEVVDVATPMTYESYTGNWQGSFEGWLDSPQTSGKFMSKTLPGLGSFYMAGQWVYMGGGVAGAAMSGRHVIQVICKQDKVQFETSCP